MKYALLLVLISFLACGNEKEEMPEPIVIEKERTTKFDKTQWLKKEGENYPYRYDMVNAVLYSDSIRTLDRNQVLNMLGEPDRMNEGHFYYVIRQRRFFAWPISTVTLVLKFDYKESVEWIKLHE